MNTYENSPYKPFLLASFVLAFSVARLQAADGTINRFNSSSEVSQWRLDFGSATHTEQFDPANDANGNAGSGSMEIILGFNPTLGGENKAAYTRDAFFPGVNGSQFSGLQMDLKIDPGSAQDAF